MIEIFSRKLTIVEDNTNSCKKCALSDICPVELMPCKDASGNVNRRFEFVKN
jgi:Na+-translocating ferredoxin:NAD+ oxidoreductase RnfC subunit